MSVTVVHVELVGEQLQQRCLVGGREPAAEAAAGQRQPQPRQRLADLDAGLARSVRPSSTARRSVAMAASSAGSRSAASSSSGQLGQVHRVGASSAPGRSGSATSDLVQLLGQERQDGRHHADRRHQRQVERREGGVAVGRVVVAREATPRAAQVPLRQVVDECADDEGRGARVEVGELVPGARRRGAAARDRIQRSSAVAPAGSVAAPAAVGVQPASRA